MPFLEPYRESMLTDANRFSWFMTTKETMDKSIFVASLSCLIGPCTGDNLLRNSETCIHFLWLNKNGSFYLTHLIKEDVAIY